MASDTLCNKLKFSSPAAACVQGDSPIFAETKIGTAPAAAPPAWQRELAEAVRCPEELCRLLGLDRRLATEAQRAAGGFPLFVPRPYLARIRPGDPADPLLLQVLPRAAETVAAPGFGTDPVGDADARCGSCLIRKYTGRILMVASQSCAVHCRFCFRRHFSFDGGEKAGIGGGGRGAEVASGQWLVASEEKIQGSRSNVQGPGQNALNLEPLALNLESCLPPSPAPRPPLHIIASDRSIHEVVLSGGDPLSLTDGELGRLVDGLGEIPHLRRLRVHTRFPVIVPQRVSNDLVSLLCGGRLSAIVVVHVNHPAEIDPDVAESLGRFIDAGIPVLSQSVLLRGINDSPDILAELFEQLVDLRVIPYYLHQLDRVAGAAHFEVPVATGRSLMAAVRARLPGYAVPRYVWESPGGTSKEILA